MGYKPLIAFLQHCGDSTGRSDIIPLDDGRSICKYVPFRTLPAGGSSLDSINDLKGRKCMAQ
jgi:hypothetical protein